MHKIYENDGIFSAVYDAGVLVLNIYDLNVYDCFEICMCLCCFMAKLERRFTIPAQMLLHVAKQKHAFQATFRVCARPSVWTKRMH